MLFLLTFFFGFPLTSVLVFRFDVGVAPPEILLQALLSAGCFYAVYYVTYKTRLRKRVADVPRRPLSVSYTHLDVYKRQVVMVAPKCPGTEVREEYKRGFGVPTLIAVHPENDPKGEGMAIAKAWAAATGGHRAGVLESSFVAEVKSDLMLSLIHI